MKDGILIGLEWEPQLSIPELSKLPVIMRLGLAGNSRAKVSDAMLFTSPLLIDLEVYTDLTINYDSFKGRVGFDNSSTYCDFKTIEVRSQPVTLEKLPYEIQKCNDELAEFMVQLSKDIIYRIGVFLPPPKRAHWIPRPAYVTTKHVNLSGFTWDEVLLSNLRNNARDYFTTSLMEKPGGVDPERLHINVPYPFTNYEELIKVSRGGSIHEYLDKPFSKEPHFVGYTDSKNKWHNMGGLI